VIVVPGIKLVDDNAVDSSHTHAQEGHLGQRYEQLSELFTIRFNKANAETTIVQGAQFLTIDNRYFVGCDKFE
jgi:hypothetical protein